MIHANIYFINNLEMDKSQYKLLTADHIDDFYGYDRMVAQTHIDNVGCIIVSAMYGDPIDNEYDLNEIYQAIESTPVYESKRCKKGTITLTESELKGVISESVKKIIKEAFSDLYEWEHFNNSPEDEDEYIPDYIDCIDPATLNDALESIGWSYYDSKDIKSKNGREYAVYYLSRNNGRAESDPDVILNTVKKHAEMPNGIFIKEYIHSYAPERRTYVIFSEIVPKENYGKQLKLDLQ